MRNQTGDRISAGELIKEARRLAIASGPFLVAYFLANLGGGVIVDVGFRASEYADVTFILATILFGYFAAWAALAKGGIGQIGFAVGFLSYFGVTFVAGIATFLGLLLLFVPGFILSVRWAPVIGYALVEGTGVLGSMRLSWRVTGNHFKPIAAALIVPILTSTAGTAIYFATSDDDGVMSLTNSALSNGLITLGAVGSMFVGLAAYSLLRDETGTLKEIFE